MNSNDTDNGIVFINRYTGGKEREKVMAEEMMRWVYGTTLGKAALHVLIKRAIFSKFLGYLKNRPSSKKEVLPFIEEYGIDPGEFLLPVEEFNNFNEFFYRELKANARPLPEIENSVVFPADGRHMGWQNASEIKDVFVKNQSFDIPALLGSPELGEQYREGTVVLSRLCPTDYHRFHFVTDGTPGETRLIKGPLASVSPYALRNRLSWLWTNKRVVTILDTPHLGQVALLDVGATGVGSIFQTFAPHQQVRKGDEKGYFAFGGSTVMTFFEPGRVQLCEDLLNATGQQYELYAKQGDLMGTYC